MELKSFVFYCSPAGTTRHLGEVIGQTLAALSCPVESCVLGRDEERVKRLLREIAESRERVCVFVGSPVYSSHALPLVMDLIDRLPRRPEAWAVPFVTWGAASSGVALAEMGSALAGRGYLLPGAAKVVAVHSLMWEAASPAGAGHPDAADDKIVAQLVREVVSSLRTPDPEPLAVEVLSYQPPAAAAVLAPQNLEMAKQLLPPREVDEKLCTQCGVCVDNCPVAALDLDPFPVCDDSSCIVCFNCVRLCPERAFSVDLNPIFEHIRKRARTFMESPASVIFLPPDRLVDPGNG